MVQTPPTQTNPNHPPNTPPNPRTHTPNPTQHIHSLHTTHPQQPKPTLRPPTLRTNRTLRLGGKHHRDKNNPPPRPIPHPPTSPTNRKTSHSHRTSNPTTGNTNHHTKPNRASRTPSRQTRTPPPRRNTRTNCRPHDQPMTKPRPTCDRLLIFRHPARRATLPNIQHTHKLHTVHTQPPHSNLHPTPRRQNHLPDPLPSPPVV